MKITIDLSDDQAAELQKTADSLGVSPQELARATFAELLMRPRQEFEKAAEYVLEKNREPYKRLR